MLDVAGVLRRSNSGKFDSVVFFDRDAQSVFETQQRIPGAIGFPGNFTEVVLLDDVGEQTVADDVDHLLPPSDLKDEVATHQRQAQLAMRHRFIQTFPFDVINLDLEEFLFKPNDPLPGRVVAAMRKIFNWQRRPLCRPRAREELLQGFSLMFTTQIGPPNIGDDYVGMLSDYLQTNIELNPTLSEILKAKFKSDTISSLRQKNFDAFFRLGMPKTLAAALMEEDWYIQPDPGILVYEFERESPSGRKYRMLHLMMEVARQQPSREHRAPGLRPPDLVTQAYYQLAESIFAKDPEVVSEVTLRGRKAKLRENLEHIFARRRQYYGAR
jgi:hypothetical protein